MMLRRLSAAADCPATHLRAPAVRRGSRRAPSCPALVVTLLVALLVPPTPVAAQGGARTTLEVAAERDALSDDYADWTLERARLHVRASTRAGVAVAGERLERFGLSDERVTGELSLPLGPRLTLSASGETSGTHRVVARSGYGGRLHLSLGGGWGIEGGASVREFDRADVRARTISLERYVSRFLVSYGYSMGSVTGAEDVASHQGRFTVFFGERGSVTVGGATGREAESLGASGVLVQDVQSLAAWGVLPLGSWLDLTWAAGTTSQGDLYTRTHMSLGARVRLR